MRSEDYDDEVGVEQNLASHMVFNIIREVNLKFRDEYGEMVICCDGGNYWRRKIFPHYKGTRKKSKEKSSIDFDKLYTSLNQMIVDLASKFPYKVIKVDYAEADDIIATLALNVEQRNIIISADHDFKQLHNIRDLKQYDPLRDKWIECGEYSPSTYLKKHILMGDSGDGIPNFKTALNHYAMNTGKRASPFGEVAFKKVMDLDIEEIVETEAEAKRVKQNEMLVNLRMIPEKISKKIMEEFEQEPIGSIPQARVYLSQRDMKMLRENLSDFSVRKIEGDAL